MRRFFFFIGLFYGFTLLAQPELEHINSIQVSNYTPVGFLNSGDEYVINGSTFTLFSNKGELQFSNIGLGNISSADIFNPLKILLFYSNFNTVLLLDNRLTEIQKIDFNTISPYRTITHVSSAAKNSFWYFNQENQRAELFDYRSNTVIAQTLPIQAEVVSMDSDYNYCHLLTKDFILCYNYQGSLLKKIPNKDYNQIVAHNEEIYLSNGKDIDMVKENELINLSLKIKDLLIKRFYLTDETLYIYDGEKLHQFQIKSE
ncbi:hypothetical protein [Aegicerativicinus sediminis]